MPRAPSSAKPARPKASRRRASESAASREPPRTVEPLGTFSAPARTWFEAVFDAPTEAQARAWPAIARRDHVLLVAPTGSGKTLAAFLAALDRLMFHEPSPRDVTPVTPEPATDDSNRKPRRRAKRAAEAPPPPGTRVLYVSPLKALGVDVERNLVAPLVGIEHAAARLGVSCRPVRVAVRSGDTPAAERRAIAKGEADVLITTPESLYLMLTSRARDALRGVETVIIDEIHALVPNERGAHLSLSLERLELLTGRPIQRVGLSATQRPLSEVARFLGGARPVTIVDASAPKRLELSIEVPFAEPPGSVPAEASTEELSVLDDDEPDGDGLAMDELDIEDDLLAALPELDLAEKRAPSTWDRIFPRLLEHVRSHHSTLIFVNSRRLAERAAQALNELAGETLVHAHHGSLAKDQRAFVESELKRGALRGLVATSSLELGIDMGAIDCVVQVEPPPSVASGLQRVGRASHHVGGVSAGVLVPKHRGEIAVCAAVAQGMARGEVEPIRYPRNPLDVLAQHVVAMCAMDDWTADQLYAAVQRSASFAELPRHLFESTLDMLSGVYAVEELAELRPRLTYDRETGRLTPRAGAQRVAVTNGGTIADRGLYGVYLVGTEGAKGRVGELDEEMVFETKPGDRFVLGASTWRVEEITHDRVVVSPAPGEPGKMPFWRGESTMRPVDLGRGVGALLRTLEGMPRPAAHRHLVRELRLAPDAADALLDDLHAQRRESALPTDARVVVETSRDDLGDVRVCVLCPLGSRVLAPWAMLVQRAAEERLGFAVEALWTNDGFVIRLPEGAPLGVEGDTSWLFPEREALHDALTELLGGTSLLAARFREAAARALLLPKKRPGQRTPLWQLRKRAQDLLRGAQRLHDFPVLLEAYRKCLRDVFDLDALGELLGALASGSVRVETRALDAPSPFATNLLFGYVATFMYEGDVPVLERRAAALAIDPARLRELLGDASLREVLDADALEELEATLRGLDRPPETADEWHDRLLRLGDVSDDELDELAGPSRPIAEDLISRKRLLRIKLAGKALVIPAEYAGRYRDALGVPLPPGLPGAFLTPPQEPLRDVLVRYAKTHGPFNADALTTRYGLAPVTVESWLARLVGSGELHEGEFRPGGSGREYVHADVLRALRKRSLDRLRRRIAPVAPHAFARFLHAWNGVTRPRPGLDSLLDAIERLQGLPVLASQLESELLAARVAGYTPHDLDTLAAAGEVVWRGVSTSGERDCRIQLFLADHAPRGGPAVPDGELDPLARRVLELLARRGASFFTAIHETLGGFAGDLVRTLWDLTLRGLVANDGFRALRERAEGPGRDRRRGRPLPNRGLAFRSRRTMPHAAEGRWSLVAPLDAPREASATTEGATDRATLAVRRWLARYGVITKEVVDVEGFPGGFGAVYPVLRAMEDAGQLLRGHFIEGITALQYTTSAALDRLRAEGRGDPRDLRDDERRVLTLAATDPANPYGALLPWTGSSGERPRRVPGATVVTVDGHLVAYLGRGLAEARSWLPEDEPDRGEHALLAAKAVAKLALAARRAGDFAELARIDGLAAAEHPLAPFLRDAGLTDRGSALTLRREPRA
jgi:ATP-dependent Lhr-like helicase